MTFTSHRCPNAFLSPALENCTAIVHPIPHSHRLSFLPPSAVTVLRVSRWRSDWSFPHKCEGPRTQPHSTAINRPRRNSGVDGKGCEKWTLHEWESKPLAFSAWKWLFMPHSRRSQLGCNAWHVPSLPHCGRFNYLPCKLAGAFISRRQPW